MEKEKLQKLIDEGHSIKTITIILKLTRQQVLNLAKKWGLKLNVNKYVKKQVPVKDLIDKYMEGKKLVSYKMVKELGITSMELNKYLKDYPNDIIIKTNDYNKLVVQKLADGKRSLEKISQLSGVGKNTIAKWKEELDLDVDIVSKLNRISKEKLDQLKSLDTANMTIKELCEATGIKVHSMYQLLKKHNLPYNKLLQTKEALWKRVKKYTDKHGETEASEIVKALNTSISTLNSSLAVHPNPLVILSRRNSSELSEKIKAFTDKNGICSRRQIEEHFEVSTSSVNYTLTKYPNRFVFSHRDYKKIIASGIGLKGFVSGRVSREQLLTKVKNTYEKV